MKRILENMTWREQILLVLGLVRSGRELTTDDLTHELTVLRRTGCVQIPPVQRSGVLEVLRSLQELGQVEEPQPDTWRWVRPDAVRTTQPLLF